MIYESKYSIGDEVKLWNSNPGIIVAVRFTKMKVFYDVLDCYYGSIAEKVPSESVFDKNAKVDAD